MLLTRVSVRDHAPLSTTLCLFYRDLTAWVVKHCLTAEGCNTLAVCGYVQDKPVYRDIDTGWNQQERCLINGRIPIEKEGIRHIVTVDLRKLPVNYVQVEAAAIQEETVNRLIKALEN